MNTYKYPARKFDKLVLFTLVASAMFAPSLGFAPPPPPDPAVPAGNMYTEYALGLGIAGYAAFAYWRAKRAAKKEDGK